MKRSFCALAALFLGTLAPGVASAFQVRPDRPRLFVSNGAGPGTPLSTYKERCTTDAAYTQRCQAGIAKGEGLFPAMALSAGYLVTADGAKCDEAYNLLQTVAADVPGVPDAHSFISNNGRVMVELAVTRDWCDPALTDQQKQWIDDQMVARSDWYLGAAKDLDIFHDDIYNVWSSVALAGLALAGTADDAKATAYLSAADKEWKDVILPALAYAGDWWHEGFVYVQPSLGGAVFYASAWTTATDEDIFALGQSKYSDLWNGYLTFHAYAMRPDYRYVYVGDTTDNKQSIELFSRYLVDMLTQGTGSALGQGLSLEILAKSQPYYDYSGADGYLLPLFYDAGKDSSAKPRSSLPTARHLGQGSNDVAVIRSGWGPDDTFIALSCGDYLGAHQHYEAGSFQIFRRSMLTGSDGYYDNFDSDHWANYYSQHSVHANVLSIYQPGEFFPTTKSLGDPAENVNDGGQRVLRRDEKGTAYPNPDLPTYLSHKTAAPFVETGDLKTFEHTACYDYVACDVTAAYDSPGFTTNGNTAKVKEVSRQFIFLAPEVLVVFDRVESTDPSFDKRFLLHALAAPTQMGSAFSITNGPGRLIGQTLLPKDADVAVIDSFTVEGKAHPPSQAGSESGGARLEISPKTEALRDYFLHVLDATDPGNATPIPASAAEDDKTITLTVDAGSAKATVAFTKVGALGGHITVKDKNDKVICDQDLGASAGAGGGGGSSGPGGLSSGEGAGGQLSPPLGDKGCGCRIDGDGDGERGRAALLLSLAAAGALRRRRLSASSRR